MDRDRLTITLRKDLLKRIDNLIDHTSIRNRSHAIETLITRAIAPKVTSAVILAGGQGAKLRPLTYELPKSLIPVKGRPLVQYTLELLKATGIKNVIFATGHMGNKIKEYFGNGTKFGLKIDYSEEKEILGTAGALKKTAHLLDGTFLAIHGDILTKINLYDLLQFHASQNVIATMALTTSPKIESFGNVRLRGAKILEFHEKPKEEDSMSLLINAGIYVFEPAIFSYIPTNNKCYLEEDIFPKLANDQELTGFTFDNIWHDVSTPSSYERVLKNWKE